MARKQPTTPVSQYLLRDIPADQWARVKSRAALDRLPLRSVLLLLAEAYASGTVSLMTLQQPATPPRRPRRK